MLGLAVRAAPEPKQIDKKSGLGSLVLPSEPWALTGHDIAEKGVPGPISHCYPLVSDNSRENYRITQYTQWA